MQESRPAADSITSPQQGFSPFWSLWKASLDGVVNILRALQVNAQLVEICQRRKALEPGNAPGDDFRPFA